MKFKKYDYVETKDGLIDGILIEREDDGSWGLEFHWGSGGGLFHVYEDEINICGNIPNHYKEIIEYYKENKQAN